jgi:O-acetyl-ADP-ribose deacetylase (regulator of RNase III)/Tfp pilus assembly protein PilZ
VVEKRIDPRVEVKLKVLAEKDQSAAIDPRIGVKLKVAVGDGIEKKEFYTVDASRGGLFLETDQPYTLGDLINIDIFIGSTTVSTKGVVVWASYSHANSQYIPGMGIKFVGIDCKDREVIGMYLGKVLRAQIAIEEDREYAMEERIVVTSENIFDYDVEAMVSFAGLGIKDIVNHTAQVIKRGGDVLNSEYERYGNDLQSGDSFLSQAGGSFNANYVIHTAIPSFHDSFGEELLRTATLAVLKKASDQVFKTVSFPAFAMLEVGFPFEVAARIMLATTFGFMSREKYPQKVFFFCNNHDLNQFEKTRKEIISR